MRLSSADLSRIMSGELRARGMPDPHITMVVDTLVEASLRGTDTHGVALFETYLKELDGGRSIASPEVRVKNPLPATTVVDANGALGIVAGHIASDIAINSAKDLGISAVAVRNSNHFGPAAAYALKMARSDTIGIVMSNADALVAPIGSSRPMLGTNPISIAIPGDTLDSPVCLDMATSQVSYSKLKSTLDSAATLPKGWAVNQAGMDLSEEDGAFAALLPLGGYKGQGMGLMIGLLCALLNQMPFDDELSHLYSAPYDQPRRVSHLIICMNPSGFCDISQFKNTLQELAQRLRAWPVKEHEPVAVPGDLEAATYRERASIGIPLSGSHETFFRSLARKYEIRQLSGD